MPLPKSEGQRLVENWQAAVRRNKLCPCLPGLEEVRRTANLLMQFVDTERCSLAILVPDPEERARLDQRGIEHLDALHL